MHILVAEDDEVLRDELKGLLQSRRHSVTAVPDGRTARILLETEPFDLVILDYDLPHIDGFQVMAQVRQARAKTAFVVITGHATEEIRTSANALGADFFLEKPFEASELERIVASIEKGTKGPS